MLIEIFMKKCSNHSHVSHLSPSVVVSIWGVWVLKIVWRFHIQLWIIWMMSIELDFSLESRHVLSMDLECASPEVSFPNQAWLCVLKSEIVFIIHIGWLYKEIEICDIEPEAHDSYCKDRWPDLEPTFWVYVIESPIWVSLKGSPNWESMRGVFFC